VTAPAPDDSPSPLRIRAGFPRTRKGVVIGTLAPFLLILAAGLPSFFRGPVTIGAEGVSFFIVLFFSMLVPLIAHAFGFTVAHDRRSVEATSEALTIDGRVALTRDQMAEGFVVSERAGRVRVRIVGQHGGRNVDIACDSRGDAESLLRALRLDVSHRLYETRGLCNVNHQNVPARIVVGADGVLVTYAGFVPYGDVTSIERDGAVTVVKRSSGGDVRLVSALHADALAERLREGLEAFRRGESAGDIAALVAQQGRSAIEWVRGLASLLKGGDYRTANVTPDALWRIAEDPAAHASARAGAAAALRPSLDDQGRARLRVAAEASASPHVRVALETVAAEGTTDDDLARALERCAPTSSTSHIADTHGGRRL
jgi:hypothetical protein